MMAAITAAQAGRNCQVIIYEGNDRIGKKILATGNGKCNFSNFHMEPSCYNGSGAGMAYTLIEQFGPQETVAFFQELGMLVKNKNGYLYPATEQASTVLDVFRFQIAELPIHVETSAKVQEILPEPEKEGFRIRTEQGTRYADIVILAAGGKAAPKTGSDGSGFRIAKGLGHSIVDCVPALVQLRCGQEPMKAVAGVRCEAEVSLWIDGKHAGTERGEVQFTDYGISGIVVFQLSRTAAYALRKKQKVTAVLDLLPDYDETAMDSLKCQRKLLFSERTAEAFFTGILHKKLMLQLLKMAGIGANQPAETIPEEKLDAFFRLCKEWKFAVTDTNSFEQAQVCAGGVDMKEVTPQLKSKIVEGLYFAGEILDVDGKCGGYNLQWAFTSGYIAGENAARQLR